MPKGSKKELSLAEEIMETDRILISLVRKNVALGERLTPSLADDDKKLAFVRYLERHAFRKEKKTPLPKAEPPQITEKEKKVQRCVRLLNTLSDPNLNTLVEVLKSMSRQDAPANFASGKNVDKKPGGKKRKGSSAQSDGGEVTASDAGVSSSSSTSGNGA